MHYKHFYITVTLRMFLVVAFTAAGTYLFVEKQQYLLSLTVFILVLWSSVNLIRYFNQINRKISFYLMALENDDTSFKIPADTGNKAIDDVFRGLERLNSLFKQTRIDIVSREQYFKSVINKSGTGLFSVNEKGRIIDINPAAVSLTGLNESHHVNSLGKVNAAIPRFLKNMMEQKSDGSAVFKNRQGLKLMFQVSHFSTVKGEVSLVAVSDITKELDIREVDAWSKLANTLTHEIMNNITPVTTLPEVIAGYYINNGKIITPAEVNEKKIANTIKGLNVIEERGRALMNFVKNYRKFTRMPEPRNEEVNISVLVENTIAAVKAYPGSEKIIFLMSSPDEVIFETDEKLLSQVLINILKNAYESVLESEQKRKIISVKVLYEGETMEIEISNNGEPVPDEIREQIFIPFFTTKEEGSGIGLSLSRQILLKMNGDIALKRSDDKMTIFAMRLNG
ncbi:MAG: GHKL domain-containing protein [Chlorobi bacterium]|nr:GHKL domain-containing protein [Chlorobiota bacterium]